MLIVPRLQQVFYLSLCRLEKCTVVDHVTAFSQLTLLRTNALSVDVICVFASLLIVPRLQQVFYLSPCQLEKCKQ